MGDLLSKGGKIIKKSYVMTMLDDLDSSSDSESDAEKANLCLETNIDNEIPCNLNFSSCEILSDSSCLSSHEVDLSYKDLLTSCNKIFEQYSKLKQKFKFLLLENEKLKQKQNLVASMKRYHALN